jgi:preprotein translocase subunit YajC
MFVTDAWAQAAGAPVSNSPLAQFFGGGMSFPIMMALMFGIMYFMLIRPQNADRKKLQEAIEKLQKGDKVLTTSGMFATVVSVETDRLVLKIADDTKVEFAKSSVAQVLNGGK